MRKLFAILAFLTAAVGSAQITTVINKESISTYNDAPVKVGVTLSSDQESYIFMNYKGYKNPVRTVNSIRFEDKTGVRKLITILEGIDLDSDGRARVSIKSDQMLEKDNVTIVRNWNEKVLYVINDGKAFGLNRESANRLVGFLRNNIDNL